MKLFVLAVLTAMSACAEDFYIAASDTGTADGSDCSNARIYTWFNAVENWGASADQINAGDTVHVCGTITAATNATLLTFRGSGSAGNPITLRFEAGAILESPRFASSVGGVAAGAIAFGSSRSYLVVDGGSDGIIRNTDNGSSLTYQLGSTGISGADCDTCTVTNLHILNIYVNVGGSGTIGGDGDNSVARAIDLNGSNVTISNNVIDHCGWCIVNFYGDGDTEYHLYGNELSHFGHAWALAPAGANDVTNVVFRDNDMHDTSNWDAAGCPAHQDGVHIFGVTGSTINGLYVSNNYFWGDWGTCPTGFVFVEGGVSNPAHVSNGYYWNNVGTVSGSTVNTNGWFGVFSGESGVTYIANNTLIGPSATNNTACFNLGPVANLTFVNNVVSPCGNPLSIGSGSTLAQVDGNIYGPSCQNGGNCFSWNGVYSGSLASWRTACNCDQSSEAGVSTLLNAVGSPQDGSPVIATGSNLAAVATGFLSSLSSDTTLGGNRTPVSRPAASAWDIGAYQYSAPTTNSTHTGGIWSGGRQ